MPTETQSGFPRSPRLLKGGLAMYDSQDVGAQPNRLIVFQYNPDQLRRTLATRAPPSEPSNAGGAREDVMRVMGPPVETINLTVELDAADQLALPDQNETTVEHGLHPTLATLEMLLYPPASRAEEIERMAERGEVQMSPANLPLTLLVWGQSRVVPVLLTSFSVAEEAFDQNLNPIQAKVELGMRVLTYMEFPERSLAREAFISYQREKENLAGEYRYGGDDSRVRALLPGDTAQRR